MMKFEKILFVMLMGVVLLSACGNNEDTTEAGGDDTSTDGVAIQGQLSAAGTGGFMHSVGASLSDIVNTNVENSNIDVLEGGGIANIQGVNNEQFPYGLAFSQDINNALEGSGDFEEPMEDFRVMAALYGGYLQVAVLEESDIHSIEDLTGSDLSPGLRGYSAEVLMQMSLEVHGLSYDDLESVEFVSTDDASNLMRDRHIDAISAAFPIPFSTYQEMDTTMGLRVLGMDEEKINELNEMNPGIQSLTIPAGTYSGNDEDVQVPGSITLLLTHKDTPNEEVYRFVEEIIENKQTLENMSVVFEDFDVEFAYENINGPIHPGAEEYFRDAGVAE